MRNLRSAYNYKSLLQKNRCGLYIHEYQAHDLLKKYKLPLVPVLPYPIIEFPCKYA